MVYKGVQWLFHSYLRPSTTTFKVTLCPNYCFLHYPMTTENVFRLDYSCQCLRRCLRRWFWNSHLPPHPPPHMLPHLASTWYSALPASSHSASASTSHSASASTWYFYNHGTLSWHDTIFQNKINQHEFIVSCLVSVMVQFQYQAQNLRQSIGQQGIGQCTNGFHCLSVLINPLCLNSFCRKYCAAIV